jgi:GTP cyclohydrolase I
MDEVTPLPIRPARDRALSARGTEPEDPLGPLIERLIREIGEDPEREGLLRTPDRVARSLRFLLSGYDLNLADIINGAVFAEPYEEMVLVRDIEVYSLCEHHLLPFFGKAHVAYLPRGRIIGLSKLPRIVEMFARRLQVQERLTGEVADWLQATLRPRGVGVVMEATHMCMSLRGVRQPGALTTTSALRGRLREDARSRQELFELIGRRGAPARA